MSAACPICRQPARPSSNEGELECAPCNLRWRGDQAQCTFCRERVVLGPPGRDTEPCGGCTKQIVRRPATPAQYADPTSPTEELRPVSPRVGFFGGPGRQGSPSQWPAPTPPPLSRPSPQVCRGCAGREIVSGRAPESVPALLCRECGRHSLDPVALGQRRAWARKNSTSKRMEFGLSGLPWEVCALCHNQRVMPGDDGTAACTACGERYLPLATRRGAVDEAPGDAEARLLGAIAAHPDDDVPRQVLADLLLERGDPRGEFILLQLEDARRGPDAARASRINALLAEHAWAWVPRGADANRCEFWRGLLWRAPWVDTTAPTHEGWATVVELTLPWRLAEPGVRQWSPLGGPTRHALQRIGRCGPMTRQWLLQDPPPNLTSLALVLEDSLWGPQLPGRLAAVLDRLPRLRELDVDCVLASPASTEPLLTQLIEVLGPRLATLWLPANGATSAAPLQRTLRQAAPHLSLRLSSSARSSTERAWVQIDAQHARVEQQGHPPEYTLAPLRALL